LSLCSHVCSHVCSRLYGYQTPPFFECVLAVVRTPCVLAVVCTPCVLAVVCRQMCTPLSHARTLSPSPSPSPSHSLSLPPSLLFPSPSPSLSQMVSRTVKRNNKPHYDEWLQTTVRGPRCTARLELIEKHSFREVQNESRNVCVCAWMSSIYQRFFIF
jgi:hypothetical protein